MNTILVPCFLIFVSTENQYVVLLFLLQVTIGTRPIFQLFFQVTI
jgi:hypothetical protein